MSNHSGLGYNGVSSTTNHDDYEIDRKARQYAMENRVDYVEALRAVVEASPGRGSATPSRPQPEAAAERDAEAVLDAKAREYAQAHGLKYVDALRQVLAQPGAAPSMTGVRSAASEADAELDRKANAYARQHGVSYSEALDQVAGSFSCFRDDHAVVCFRESAGPVSAESAVQMLEGQWIEIFRAGTHVDDSGSVSTFTNQDVAAIAEGYRPALREAPLVIGHPQANQPAYGWVSALRAEPNGILTMRVRDVAPVFAEAVRAGRFRKRSASFYPPYHPSNPNPGFWYLRHVGFLGAAQPAIAGLSDVQFG